MMLFFQRLEGIKAIPLKNVLSIEQQGKEVSVYYDEKSLIYLEDGTPITKISEITLIYESEIQAQQEIYVFYKALRNGEHVYNFSADFSKFEKNNDENLWF